MASGHGGDNGDERPGATCALGVLYCQVTKLSNIHPIYDYLTFAIHPK